MDSHLQINALILHSNKPANALNIQTDDIDMVITDPVVAVAPKMVIYIAVAAITAIVIGTALGLVSIAAMIEGHRTILMTNVGLAILTITRQMVKVQWQHVRNRSGPILRLGLTRLNFLPLQDRWII